MRVALHVLIFDDGINPDTVEDMTLSRLLFYAELKQFMRKERGG